jgi:hypothetical protein
MPNRIPPDDEDSAALAAWERGQGDAADTPDHPKRARLRAIFDVLPDVRTLQTVLDAAMNDSGPSVPLAIEADPAMLQLLSHIERLDAAAAGRAPVPVERIVGLIVSNHLQNLLHQLVTDPTSHPHYAKAWNALCAAEGVPDLAVPEGMAENGPQKAEEGPF